MLSFIYDKQDNPPIHTPSTVRRLLPLLLPLMLLMLVSCKGEKKIVHYATLYEEAPRTIYMAPLFDLTTRSADADSARRADYQRQDIAARYFLRTLPIGVRQRGYSVAANDSIMTAGIATARRLKALHDNDLAPYCATYDADAVLICSLHAWKGTRTEPLLYAEYQLRSTKSGRDLLHTWVRLSRTIDTTYRGDLIALYNERTLALEMGIDLQAAIRCYMVQQVNLFITHDLPFTPGTYFHGKDLYLHATQQYLKATIDNEGALTIEPFTMEEFENECFL